MIDYKMILLLSKKGKEKNSLYNYLFYLLYLMISFTQAFYGMDDLFYMKLMNDMDEIINETTHTDLTKKF